MTNLEEVSYLTGLRDFSKDNTAKIWSKMLIDGDKRILFDKDADEYISKARAENAKKNIKNDLVSILKRIYKSI